MKSIDKVYKSIKKNVKNRISIVKLKLCNPELARVIRFVQKNNLTYLDADALINLHNAIREVESEHVTGDLIEAGCALGGSSIVMAASKKRERPLKIFDTFSIIPPPTENDENDSILRYKTISSGQAVGISGDTYYGYIDDLLGKVKGSFVSAGYPSGENNVAFIPGLYESSLHLNDPVALAHIDCDWYDSVMICLTRIVPHLSKGGILVIDDYYHWLGCRNAVDSFFKNTLDDFEFIHGARLRIRKK